MRIVNLETFRKMPEGAIFCKYVPCYFGELEVFGGVFGDADFTSSTLIQVDCDSSAEQFDILSDAEENGTAFNLSPESFSRDGMYDKEQLFAVFENKDIEQLIEVFKKAIH